MSDAYVIWWQHDPTNILPRYLAVNRMMSGWRLEYADGWYRVTYLPTGQNAEGANLQDVALTARQILIDNGYTPDPITEENE